MNSRSRGRLPSTWRRRQCKQCVAQFSTIEGADLETSFLVTGASKPNPFRRDILFVSLLDALKHRDDAIAAAGALADTVIAKLLKAGRRPAGQPRQAAFSTNDIATTSWQTLRRFDPLAAGTYKAFHHAALAHQK